MIDRSIVVAHNHPSDSTEPSTEQSPKDYKTPGNYLGSKSSII